MSRCEHCGVYIHDDTEVCPLCRCVIEKTGEEENLFPDIKQKNRTFHLLTRIYLFVAIVTEVLLIDINIKTNPDTLWCVIVGFVLAYGYMTMAYTVSGKAGYIKKIVVGAIGVVAVLVAIDEVTGDNRWSFNFALPGLLGFLDIIILVLMLANKRAWYSYLSAQIFAIMLAALSLIFIPLGFITYTTPIFTMFVVTVLCFMGTVIIGGDKSMGELKRRFHF